jgi:hypothetical protein
MNPTDPARHTHDPNPAVVERQLQPGRPPPLRRGWLTHLNCLGFFSSMMVACASGSTAPITAPSTVAPQQPPPQRREDDHGCRGSEFPDNTVIVCSLKKPGEFRVINKKAEPVSLLSSVRVQIQGIDGSWRTTSERAYLSRPTTEGERTGCRVLLAGEELSPPPWGGFDCTNPFRPYCGDSQSSPGRARLVVMSCDRSQSFEGPPFALVEYAVENAL